MQDHDHQQKITFSRKTAVLGLVAYLLVVVVVYLLI